MKLISEFKYSISRQSLASCSVHPEQQFCEIVERERLRSHRSRMPFSILVFDDVNSNKSLRYDKLIVLLKERLRVTDEIGWYRNKRLAVLLPDTREAGAEILAKDILRKMHPSKLSIQLQVYPGTEKVHNDGNDKNNKMAESHSTDFLGDGTCCIQNQSCIRFDSIDYGFIPKGPKWKRVIDIIGSVSGLILLWPLFLIIAVYIKIVSPGPVIFKQQRLGFRREPFTIYKFRTMHVCAESEQHQEYLKSLIKNDTIEMKKLDQNDSRIIPFGKIIRAAGLDELPQLFNVVKGDMSIVGPRPCMAYEAEEYSDWQDERFDTKPGLTGLWQVSGKNRTSFLEMMRFDARYAKRRSFLKDVFIIFMTVPALFVQIMDGMPKKDTKND